MGGRGIATTVSIIAAIRAVVMVCEDASAARSGRLFGGVLAGAFMIDPFGRSRRRL
jgi:hypothetical protein